MNAAKDAAKLRLLCAWCGKTMREAEPGSEDDSVSHGICDSCADRERAKAKRPAGPGSFLGGALVAPRTTRAAQNEELKPAMETDDEKGTT
jgi:hypothetical protein